MGNISKNFPPRDIERLNSIEKIFEKYDVNPKHESASVHRFFQIAVPVVISGVTIAALCARLIK